MKAMILAAGRGERMRPLTDTTPKPLLCAGGKPLIVWHLERLAQAGFRDIVINHAWLGPQLEEALGNGSRWGARIQWSPEPEGGLETAGGIARALRWLGPDPFLVINGDIWCDWDPGVARRIATDLLARHAGAWLLLVANPDHHPEGDFWLAAGEDAPGPGMRRVFDRPGTADAVRLTFSGIGIYRPELFAHIEPGQWARLAPLLRTAMERGEVWGACHHGAWTDVGTPARLARLDAALRAGQLPGCSARNQ